MRPTVGVPPSPPLPLEYYEAQKAKKIVLFTEGQRGLEAGKAGEVLVPEKLPESQAG